MSYENTRIEQWIFEQLSDDSTVIANTGAHVADATKAGIYIPTAPEGSTYPIVRFNLQAATDVLSMGTTRSETSCIYQVLCVDETQSYQGLETLADRVDTLLTNPADTTVDSHVVIGFGASKSSRYPSLRTAHNTAHWAVYTVSMFGQRKETDMTLTKVVIAKDYNQHSKGDSVMVDPGRAAQWAKDGICESRTSNRPAKRNKSAARKSDTSDRSDQSPGNSGNDNA